MDFLIVVSIIAALLIVIGIGVFLYFYRNLSEEEIRLKKRLALVTLKLLIIGLLIFLALVFQR
ncbi:hypothetical protein ACSAZK_12820 [Methanosarcina sp. Mfa9]|uniref:hypothetical protein n=1 Tax=Methanosarcina sp. Mfa9 TaxID=3439063 RepID=UPI003F85A183